MNKLRLQMILGKFIITKIENGYATVALGGTTTMRFPIPERADLRMGDMLTFYTEAPMKEQPYATTISTQQ